MPTTAGAGRRMANRLYQAAFPVYRPLYAAYKAYADRAERRLLSRSVSPGSLVIDGGANIGIYSQFLSRCVGPAGAVHSFEPSPENFAHLRAAVAGLPNVQANQVALSDKTGESVLYVSDELNVDHRSYPTKGETRRAVPVRSTTLDDYCRAGERVDLIKLDIQGFELHALRGASRVLADNPDIKLLVEIWPYGLRLAGTSAEELMSFLQERNFAVQRWEGSRLVESRRRGNATDPRDYWNVFARNRTTT